jgi:hypothetical protein
MDVGGETVRVFGRPEELAERLEASGYDTRKPLKSGRGTQSRHTRNALDHFGMVFASEPILRTPSND